MTKTNVLERPAGDFSRNSGQPTGRGNHDLDELVERVLACADGSVDSLHEGTELLKRIADMFPVVETAEPLDAPAAYVPKKHPDMTEEELRALVKRITDPQGWFHNFSEVRKALIDKPDDTPVLLCTTKRHERYCYPTIKVRELDPAEAEAFEYVMHLPEEEREKLGLKEVLATKMSLGRAEQFDETWYEVPSHTQKFEMIDAGRADKLRYDR